jgi:protein-tyrosine phosphatase
LTLFQRKTHVLLVCTENICRSPLAEGLLRHHLQHSGLGDRVKVRSAGTRTSQPGCRPDQRAQRVAAEAGINLGRIRSRRITEQDFVQSDLIVAMDRTNIRDLEEICPRVHRHKISLLLSFQSGLILDEVPDPYYGSVEGFDKVFQLIDAAVIELTSHIADQF